MNDIECLAEADVYLKADRSGGVRYAELGHIQAELIREGVEIVELVSNHWVVKVEAVVSVQQTAEVDRAHRPPPWRRNGSRRRCWRCRGCLRPWRGSRIRWRRNLSLCE